MVPVAPPSPDGFGSFESGLEEDAVRSPGFAVNAAEADPWGSSAWAESKPQEEEEVAIDEWERAKQEKAKQDRRVVSPDYHHNLLDLNIHSWSSLRNCSQVSLLVAKNYAAKCARIPQLSQRPWRRTPGLMIAAVEWTESRGCESTPYFVANVRS